MSAPKKILSREAAVNWRKTLRANSKKLVFTNGCFDIIHSGHIKILSASKALGDFLIVGLNSDSSVRRLKGSGRPVNPQNDRALVLAALETVDKVVIFNEDTPLALIKALRPDILVKGADYKPHEVVGRQYAGCVKTIPLLKGRSTTNIIKKMANTCGQK